MEEDVLALKPAAVVLLTGTNDLEEGATPDSRNGFIGLEGDRGRIEYRRIRVSTAAR